MRRRKPSSTYIRGRERSRQGGIFSSAERDPNGEGFFIRQREGHKEDILFLGREIKTFESIQGILGAVGDFRQALDCHFDWHQEGILIFL